MRTTESGLAKGVQNKNKRTEDRQMYIHTKTASKKPMYHTRYRPKGTEKKEGTTINIVTPSGTSIGLHALKNATIHKKMYKIDDDITLSDR